MDQDPFDSVIKRITKQKLKQVQKQINSNSFYNKYLKQPEQDLNRYCNTKQHNDHQFKKKAPHHKVTQVGRDEHRKRQYVNNNHYDEGKFKGAQEVIKKKIRYVAKQSQQQNKQGQEQFVPVDIEEQVFYRPQHVKGHDNKRDQQSNNQQRRPDRYNQSTNNHQYFRRPQEKPRNHTQTKQNHHKKQQYQNHCQKFLRNYQKLKENQEQLGIQIKKLKKYFLASQMVQGLNSKPQEISVMKCLDSPVIFFEYVYNGEKRYMLLREAQKGTLKTKTIDFYETVKKVYDMHYFPVDICYEEAILQFVKLRADDLNIRLALNHNKKFLSGQGDKKTQKLFYYCISKQNTIDIIFFDFAMRQVFLYQEYIQRNKRNVSKQAQQSYEKFSRNVKNNQQADQVNFGEQEVQSQDQKNCQSQNSIDIQYELKKIQKRLTQILGKDISDLEEQMEAKNNQLNQMMQNQSPERETMDKLGQQVDKSNRDIEDFKRIRSQISQKLTQMKKASENDKQKLIFLKLALKRMIMVQKQLQSDLPILGKKKQIFQLLDKHNLIILEGQTGSGKSTQLPQLLCEYYKLFENPKALPVLITQPRKIATRSLAQRVAQELQQNVGQFVDYVASSSKFANPKAKIVFKLDRLVLDELVESPTLDSYSCLVIDEAHERTISIDVILGLVKQLLRKRQGFKVIITSASMEISLFQRYFKTKTLKVSGRMYPVNIRYLPSKQQDMVKKIQKAIQNQLLTQRKMLKDKYKGHILVFCSDTGIIQALTERFRKTLNHNVFLVIPLHGKLSPQDQKKAFLKTKQHKLIFASRVAQTAITIDGVKVVIDPGQDRQMQYNQQTKFSSMKLTTISQSSAKQRAGRAGRTQQGYCFRLYQQKQFNKRPFNKLPQIQNIALDTLILRLKTLGIENVAQFDYIQKPNQAGMKTSLQVLKMIGCLDQNQMITSIGKFIVKIPIQPFLARAIIEGLLMEKTLFMERYYTLNKRYTLFTQSVIEILCMVLSAGNLFRITENFRQLADNIKYQNFSHQKGDFFFLKKIYDEFKKVSNYDKTQLNQWLNKNFLIKKTLFQVRELIKQIKSILKLFHVDQKQMKRDIIKCKVKLQKYVTQEDRILSCLSTSFAANLCLYSGHAQIGYTYMSLEKTITIYGTSCLSLLGVCPKWILAYDFYENKDGKVFCKVANEISYKFLENTVQPYVYQKYQLDKVQRSNPFYKKITYDLQTFLISQLKQTYRGRQYSNDKQVQFMKKIDLDFNQAQNKMTVFVRCEQIKQNEKKQAKKPDIPVKPVKWGIRSVIGNAILSKVSYLLGSSKPKLSQKYEDKQKQTQVQTKLRMILQKLRKKASTNYTHNYIGNIYVTIGNGMQIKTIEFKNTQTLFQISNLQQEMFRMIIEDWSSQTYIQTFGKGKIKIYLDDENMINQLNQYLQFQRQKNPKIIVRKQISDKRKKIPQTKIYLNWFAGYSTKNNILLSFNNKDNKYQPSQNIQEQVSRYQGHIIDAVAKIIQNHQNTLGFEGVNAARNRGRGANRRGPFGQARGGNKNQNQEKLYMIALNFGKIMLTKKGNAINIFNNEMDQIQIHRFLKTLVVSNIMSPHFKMPSSIRKFRQPQLPYCTIKDSQWVQKIQKLLEQVTDKKENCLRVWGYNVRSNPGDKMSQYQKSFRVDMKGEIKTFDIGLLRKMKEKYDGKRVLGCQKLHISSIFSQSIPAVGSKAFQNLKQEFDYNAQNFKLEYPSIQIHHYQRNVSKNKVKQMVYIQICSQNRQDLLKPVRILNELFTPKYIPLLDTEFRFLNNYQGDKVLDQIESLYDYKIYFGFDKNQRKLKLYCHDTLEEDIKKSLKQQLSKIKYFDQSISYKGRNLKKIQLMLKQQIQKIKFYNNNNKAQKFLAYEIKFTRRQIAVTADIETFNLVKSKILQVQVQQNQKMCQICNDMMMTPYKLLNCSHSFCWFCLASMIKQFKFGQLALLKCCHQDQKNNTTCDKLISIYDISKILSQQQLQQIFDVKISKYVESYPDKYMRCFSPNCEQIFEKQFIKDQKQIDCQLCGKNYCYACKQSHKNYTCLEWKDRHINLSKNQLNQLGIKKCPKCSNGIQKNQGCQHIACRCGAHICWKCLSSFATPKECYDHLAQKCGGIFADGHQ